MITINTTVWSISFESSDIGGWGEQHFYVASKEDGEALLQKVLDQYLTVLREDPEIQDPFKVERYKDRDIIEVQYRYVQRSVGLYTSRFSLSSKEQMQRLYEAQDDITEDFAWNSRDFAAYDVELHY